jgi:hypothetical protein
LLRIDPGAQACQRVNVLYRAKACLRKLNALPATHDCIGQPMEFFERFAPGDSLCGIAGRIKYTI